MNKRCNEDMEWCKMRQKAMFGGRRPQYQRRPVDICVLYPSASNRYPTQNNNRRQSCQVFFDPSGKPSFKIKLINQGMLPAGDYVLQMKLKDGAGKYHSEYDKRIPVSVAGGDVYAQNVDTNYVIALNDKLRGGFVCWEVPCEPKGFYPFHSPYTTRVYGVYVARSDVLRTLIGLVHYGKGRIVLDATYPVDEFNPLNDLLFYNIIVNNLKRINIYIGEDKNYIKKSKYYE